MSRADIVIFGEDWGRHPTATQALAAELARERRILWVDSVGLRRPHAGDLRRLLGKARAAAAGPGGAARVAGPGPAEVVAPLAVPLPGSRLARRLNPVLWRHGVGRRAARLGFDRPILWVSLPTALDARRALPHRALVYYCGDDFAALDGVDHGPVTRMEADLAGAADLIVVSHLRLVTKFPAEKVLYLPHGVDCARFASVADASPVGPPVAGYLGLIDGRTDFDALEAAARALPGWVFELAGPVASEVAGRVARLDRLPNLRLTGPVPAAEVPALFGRWTAGLLPYRDTPMTRACDPLKLREYLAAGLPVVAFPFAAALPAAAAVRVCAPAALAAGLQAARAEPATRRADRRRAMAAQDWGRRAETLGRALDALA